MLGDRPCDGLCGLLGRDGGQLSEGKEMSRKDMAIATLDAGGYFRKALETGYRGAEKFEMRLRTASGSIVKGVGFKTFLELKDADLLKSRPCAKSSTWASEWILNKE
jgi:hypothetical protein